jgi:hypothetical protein
MTFPDYRPTATAPPTSKCSLTVPISCDPVDDATTAHTDYDLGPLTVDGLDHYVIVDSDSRRFHVR